VQIRCDSVECGEDCVESKGMSLRRAISSKQMNSEVVPIEREQMKPPSLAGLSYSLKFAFFCLVLELSRSTC
jgi:hypothetical protein